MSRVLGAGTLDCLVPIVSYRLTGQEGFKKDRHKVARGDDHGDITDTSKPNILEECKVEMKNGKFDGGVGSAPDRLAGGKCNKNAAAIGGLNIVCMVTFARPNGSLMVSAMFAGRIGIAYI